MPTTYPGLKQQAKIAGETAETPEEYLDHFGGAGNDLREFTGGFAETIEHFNQGRVDAALKHDVQAKALWPQISERPARYQTMIDNQLSKALLEYHQFHDERTKTVEVDIESSPAKTDRN